ncbi:MAG: hypothetical protein CK424_02245 [Legionella sp.]|nr:MAG: hypothetical protein CK424_02245 [Legionella sp.]
MKKITGMALISLLVSGIGYAAQPCDGFQVVVKNNTSEKLYATTAHLNRASIQPGLVELNAQSEVTFTVSNSEADAILDGELVFRTFSLPSKKVHIAFDLKHQILICEHTNKEVKSDYSVLPTRMPGKVTYNIG